MRRNKSLAGNHPAPAWTMSGRAGKQASVTTAGVSASIAMDQSFVPRSSERPS
jgi:hypothetical protein